MEGNEEVQEIEQTWNKIENISKKVGLREGIAAGRASNFQDNFDVGFKEGFKNGFALGKYKGALVAHSRQCSSPLVNYPLLEKVSRGGCELCKNEQLMKDDIQEIIKMQTELTNKSLKELHYMFNTIFSSIELSKSLER